jgi:hypothetical protein
MRAQVVLTCGIVELKRPSPVYQSLLLLKGTFNSCE